MAVGNTNSVNNNIVYPNNNIGNSYGNTGIKSFTPQSVNNIFNTYYNKASEFTVKPTLYTQIKREAAFLKVASEDIMSYSKTPFKKKAVVSENNDLVTIKASDKAAPYGFKAEINVKQVATSQKNTGTQLNANDLYAGDRGTNHFTISTGGKSYNLSVNVKSTDTNKTAMQNVANAINEKKIGIVAEVKYDATTKKSQLIVTSEKTGENSSFEISDVKGFGNSVSSLGLSNKTEDAKSAVYSLNGGAEVTSSSNEINIGSGVTAILKKADDNPVKITTGADTTAIKTAITDFVKSYNELLKTADGGKGDKIADKTASKLRMAAKSYSPTLLRTGLTIQDDGSIKIDNEKLDKAIKDGSAERTFAPFGGILGGGFASRTAKVSGDAYKEAGKATTTSQFTKVQPNDVLNSYFDFINQQNSSMQSYSLFGRGSAGSLYDILL